MYVLRKILVNGLAVFESVSVRLQTLNSWRIEAQNPSRSPNSRNSRPARLEKIRIVLGNDASNLAQGVELQCGNDSEQIT